MDKHMPGIRYACDDYTGLPLCPLHAAASELLAALEDKMSQYCVDCTGKECEDCQRASIAISNARGWDSPAAIAKKKAEAQ